MVNEPSGSVVVQATSSRLVQMNQRSMSSTQIVAPGTPRPSGQTSRPLIVIVRHQRFHQPQWKGPILIGARVTCLRSSHIREGTLTLSVSASRIWWSSASAGPIATLRRPGLAGKVSCASLASLPPTVTVVLAVLPSGARATTLTLSSRARPVSSRWSSGTFRTKGSLVAMVAPRWWAGPDAPFRVRRTDPGRTDTP